MKSLVLDASVVAKLYFPEPGSDLAEAAIGGGRELVAPDLLWAEIGSVSWKRARRGDITHDAAMRVVEAASGLPIRSVPIRDYICQASAIALQSDRSVYDCVYLAVAIAEDGVVLSADARFVEAIRSGAYAAFVAMLGE